MDPCNYVAALPGPLAGGGQEAGGGGRGGAEGGGGGQSQEGGDQRGVQGAEWGLAPWGRSASVPPGRNPCICCCAAGLAPTPVPCGATQAHPCLRVSAGAAEQADQLAARLAELQVGGSPGPGRQQHTVWVQNGVQAIALPRPGLSGICICWGVLALRLSTCCLPCPELTTSKRPYSLWPS